MRRPRAWALMIALLIAGASVGSQRSETASGPPRAIAGGATSMDGLIDEFLTAIENKDAAALRRLRLTRDEYLEIVVPGNVPKGQPPLQTFEKNNQFFWSLLDTKSEMFGKVLIKDWGGLRYTGRTIEFSEPAQEHDWYTARGELRLKVTVADSGKSYTLRSGWIAQVGDRYKFIGYEWDD